MFSACYMMDVNELEENLKCYQEQLQEINEALNVNTSNEDLNSLKNDLTELIAITEHSLLNIKKKELLSSLEEDKTEEDSGDEADDLRTFIGMKCSVPYKTSFGTSQQQNCVIMSISEDDDRTAAAVLFMTPTAISMLPCKLYLKNRCFYDCCKYSHGYKVPIDDISDYIEPNFENFEKGKRCLCKNDNELWVPATVQEVYDDYVLVKYDGNAGECKVSYDDVFPLDSYDNDSDSEPDISCSYHETFTISQTSDTFGGWEEYTNSFGSRMLQKMGYVPGNGLGPRGKGMLNPVEADIIPAGMSLDFVKNMREKSLIRTVSKLNTILKKHQKRKLTKKNCRLKKSESMFHMVDGLMRSKNAHSYSETNVSSSKNKKALNKASDKTVRANSVSVENDINKSKKRLSDLKKSLNRNKHDSIHCKRLQENIRLENSKLNSLYAKQDRLDSELKVRSDKAKLKIF